MNEKFKIFPFSRTFAYKIRMDSSLEMPLIRVFPAKRNSWFQRFYKCICCCNRRVSFIQYNANWKEWRIWAKILKKLKKEVKFDNIYTILLDLYSHKSINLAIKECKLEPDSKYDIRDDLEFYIPQLW